MAVSQDLRASLHNWDVVKTENSVY